MIIINFNYLLRYNYCEDISGLRICILQLIKNSLSNCYLYFCEGSGILCHLYGFNFVKWRYCEWLGQSVWLCIKAIRQHTNCGLGNTCLESIFRETRVMDVYWLVRVELGRKIVEVHSCWLPVFIPGRDETFHETNLRASHLLLRWTGIVVNTNCEMRAVVIYKSALSVRERCVDT